MGDERWSDPLIKKICGSAIEIHGYIEGTSRGSDNLFFFKLLNDWENPAVPKTITITDAQDRPLAASASLEPQRGGAIPAQGGAQRSPGFAWK